jgi:hypothetical protein
MNTITTNPAVAAIVSKLEKKGYHWNAQDDESVYLSRKRGASTFYAQVDCYDGETVTVNGGTLQEFLANFG